MINFIKRRKTSLFVGLFCLLSAGGLLWAAHSSVAFAEGYALWVFPFFTNTIGRFFGLFPFSFFEGILFVGGGLVALAFVLFLTLKRFRGRHGALLGRYIPFLFALLCAVFLLFTLSCGINYGRAAFGDFVAQPSSIEDLLALYDSLAADLNRLAPQIENGATFRLETGDETAAREAMLGLSQAYPQLGGFYPKPKPVFLSRGMSYLGITGIYSFLTVEANYNNHVPGYVVPYTICHELAHLKGYMRENEAGFVAYVACESSASPRIGYSGALSTTVYVLNALYATVSNEEYRALYDRLPVQAQRDLSAATAYWKQFEGPVAEVSDKVNDIYLKANGQKQGVQSYGEMVDLLIAYHRSK